MKHPARCDDFDGKDAVSTLDMAMQPEPLIEQQLFRNKTTNLTIPKAKCYGNERQLSPKAKY